MLGLRRFLILFTLLTAAHAQTGTFTNVQVPGSCGGGSNCEASGASGSSVNITVGTQPAAGNLSIFSCAVNGSVTAPGVNFISSVNVGGSLVLAPVVLGTQNSASSAAMAYILPKTNTGVASTTVTITFATAILGPGSGSCEYRELHPSANPNNVGIDLSMANQFTASSAPVGQSGTFSATNDACWQMELFQNGFASVSSVTSPYNTNLYAPGDEGFSTAPTPANGNGPTWTLSGSIGGGTFGVCWGWNPTPFSDETFFDGGSAAGANNAHVTAAALTSGTFGANPGHWTAGTVGSNQLFFQTAASLPLRNGTRRLGTGASYTDNGTPMGVAIVGDGNASDTDEVFYTWNNQSVSAAAGQKPVSALFYYYSTMPQNDGSLVDCGGLQAGNTTNATINCYGTGANRYVRLETTCGNGPTVNLASNTEYYFDVLVTPGASGSLKMTVFNAATGATTGTSNVTGCSVETPTAIDFGKGNPGSAMTNGAVIYMELKKIDYNGVFPLSQGCFGASPTWWATTDQTSAQTCFTNASSGDTVNLLNWVGIWNTQVTITGKQLNVLGSTVVTPSGTAGSNTFSLSASDNSGTCVTIGSCVTLNTDQNFAISNSAANFVRVSGITFIDNASSSHGLINFSGTHGQVGGRFDHNHTLMFPGSEAMFNTGGYGLADNNLFDDTGAGGGQPFVIGGDFPSNGYKNWQDATNFGSNEAWILEQNVANFTGNGDGFIDCYYGAKVTPRYNTINNTGTTGSSLGFCHGTDSGGFRSAVSVEAYNNYLINNTSGTISIGNTRGGTIYYLNNTHVGTHAWTGIDLQYYRFLDIAGKDISTWGAAIQGLNWTPQTISGSGNPNTLNGADWQATHAYSGPSGGTSFICPTSNNSGNNCFQTQGACTSSSSRPTFPTNPANGPIATVGDGTCTWANVGGNISASPNPGVASGFCAVNPDTPCSSNTVCNGLSGGDTCSRFFDTNGGVYPFRDQPGRVHNQTLAPNYACNNGGAQAPGSFLGTDAATSGIIQSGTDYFNTTCPPGYVPYTYPDPLQGTSTAATPTATPVAGTYTGTQNVALSTTLGAIICYTTNGTTPATNGTTGCTTGSLYSTPIPTTIATTINAIAGGTGFFDSAVLSSAYTIIAATPVLSPAGGNYTITFTVTMTTAGPGVICYTSNGTTPATNGSSGCTTGSLYSTPVTVTAPTTTTLKAIAGGTGLVDSAVDTEVYTFNSIAYSTAGITVVKGSAVVK